MTDSTPPPTTRQATRTSYEVPDVVLDRVRSWADERGISTNAGLVLLLRSALTLAIRDPKWLPNAIIHRGPKTRRAYSIPAQVAAVLAAWTRREGFPSRDVAVTILVTAALDHSARVALPFPSLPLPAHPDRPEPKGRTVSNTTTTVYGSWPQYVDNGTSHDPADYIRRALGDFAADYNLDSLETAFRAALAEQLPDGVILTGDQFIGPAYPADPIAALEGPGFTQQVTDAIDAIDFYALAEQHLIETEN